MNSETKLVLEIWENFRDLIPASKRLAAAEKLLNLFIDYDELDFDPSMLSGEDEYLDEIIENLDNDFEDDDL